MDQFPIYFYTDFKKDTVLFLSTRDLPVCIFTEESKKPMPEQEMMWIPCTGFL
jgi:hypothetical protein